MKIFNVSKNGKMYLIGDREEESKWYLITAKIAEDAKKFKVGDEVDIQSSLQGGSYYLSFIGALGSVAKPATTASPENKGKDDAPYYDKPADKKYYGKSVEERNDIKRQAIAHATSRVLQGIVTPDNVIDLMDKVYKKFIELVG